MNNTIPENKYSANVASEINLEAMKSIVIENEKSSYSARFSGVIFFLKFALLPVLIIVSGSAGSTYVFTSIYSVTSTKPLAMTFGVIFFIIVEGIKIGLGYELCRFLVGFWFKEGRHYIMSFFVLLLIAGGAFAASMVCSIKGLPTTFEIAAGWIYNPQNEQLNEIDKQISEARATKTAKGETTWNSTKAIATLSEQRAAVLNEIQADKLEFKERVKAIGTNFSFFGGGIESLTLLSLLMVATYRRYSYLEIKDTDELEEIRKMIGEKTVKKN